mgnify:CR=1 FL=1
MTGLQYTTDEKGRKTTAVIDLEKHAAIWEEMIRSVVGMTPERVALFETFFVLDSQGGAASG